MSYPGAWQQLGDYSVYGQGIPFDDGNTDTIAQVPTQTRSGDATADMQNLLSQLAGTPYAGSPGASAGNGYVHFTGALGYSSENPPTGSADAALGLVRVGPTSLAPPSSIVPAAPPHAVGYEWQTPDGAVTACRITLNAVQANGGSSPYNAKDSGNWSLTLGMQSDSPSVPLAHNGSTLTATADNGQTTDAYWTQTLSPTVSGYADIGGLGPDGRFIFSGEAHASVSVFYDDPFQQTSWGCGLQYAVRTDGVNGSITVNYTVQPPLFRWLYDTPPVPPRLAPNRIFQRGNDGLGASGGRRILQGKTMQATNRVGRAVR